MLLLCSGSVVALLLWKQRPSASAPLAGASKPTEKSAPATTPLAGTGKPAEKSTPTPATTKPDVSEPARQPVAEFTVQELLEAFRTGLSADRKFGGKAILLKHCWVKSSQLTDRGPMVRVVNNFTPDSIDCYFRSKEQAASLEPDEWVIIIGVCKGANAHGTVDLVDCELAVNLTKHWNVPPILVSRFDELKPVKKFTGPERPKYLDHKSMSGSEGQIVEVSGILGVDGAVGDRIDYFDPTMTTGSVICHFDPAIAVDLKKVIFGNPVRVRGKVVYVKTNDRYQLYDCGLAYGK
jgi:hypothetical protein